jgi:FkbM family methyltransferase
LLAVTPRVRLKHWLHEHCPGIAGRFRYFGVRVFFPKNSLIFRMACEQGIYEKDEARLLGALANMRPESVCFDVGANIGLMAIPVLDACRDCSVVSFEPSPDTFRFLAQTVAGSRFGSRWSAVSKALGEQPGNSDFFSANDGLGAYDGLADTQRSKGARKVTVPVTTLDAEWERLGKPRVSVIKIDVEGAELQVLAGARACIASEQPPILAEWTRLNLAPYNHSASDLLIRSSEIGYGVYSLPDLLPVTTLELLELQMLRTVSFLLAPLHGLFRGQ